MKYDLFIRIHQCQVSWPRLNWFKIYERRTVSGPPPPLLPPPKKNGVSWRSVSYTGAAQQGVEYQGYLYWLCCVKGGI